MLDIVTKCRSPDVDKKPHEECKTCFLHLSEDTWDVATYYYRHSWKFRENGYCDSYCRASFDLLGHPVAEKPTLMGFSAQATRELR